MVTTFIPMLGFFIYLLLGFEGRKYKSFKTKAASDEAVYSDFYTKKDDIIYKQISYLKSKQKLFKLCGGFWRAAVLNIISADAPLSSLYGLKIYSEGKEKFSALFEDIKRAENIILIEYYIIRSDELGFALKELLIKKASEGVKIYLLYDGMGCIGCKKGFFDFGEYKNIYSAVFLPPKFIRINYRCHRKICIIDYKKAYIGGFNIGVEYMGISKKFSSWRDCHISFFGSAVADLALRFICDFNFFSEKKLSVDDINNTAKQNNSSPVQIISGGADCKRDNILNCFFRLISAAEESILIQTPYFVPDESIIEALKTAALSGVRVKIMIPSKPDHPFVYWASLSYIGELLETGAECYGYDGGFLHSKLIICDEFAVSVGTANLDIRSLKLNFETCAVIYDKQYAKGFVEAFNSSLAKCKKITAEDYKKRSPFAKVKESVARLISPML